MKNSDTKNVFEKEKQRIYDNNSVEKYWVCEDNISLHEITDIITKLAERWKENSRFNDNINFKDEKYCSNIGISIDLTFKWKILKIMFEWDSLETTMAS